MATYPGAIPDLDTDFYANPLGAQKYLDLLAELQEVFSKLGINPQGMFGTVAARLAEVDAKTASLANFGARNLRIANTAATPTTKLDVTCDSLGIEGSIADAIAVTVDLTATGKNGTAFARAVNTWYYVWLGLNPGTGEVAGLFDNDPTRAGLDTSHASLAGFSKWRRVGARRTDATSGGQFLRATQHGDQVAFDGLQDAQSGINGVVAPTWANKPLTNSVPPTSRLALVQAAVGTGTNVTLSVRPVNSTVYINIANNYGGSAPLGSHWVTLDASAAFEWSTNAAAVAGVSIGCLGYRDSL